VVHSDHLARGARDGRPSRQHWTKEPTGADFRLTPTRWLSKLGNIKGMKEQSQAAATREAP